MKKVIGVLAVTALMVLFLNHGLMASNFKIAIVDLQKALNTCQAGKIAKAKLQKKFDKMKADLDRRRQELQKMKQELEKQSMMMSLEAREDKEREYRRKVRDFQDLLQEYKDEMSRAQYEAVQPILRGLQQTTEEIRKKEGYLIVFEKNDAGIVCYQHGLDITDKVVKLYNQEWSKTQHQKKAK